MAYTTIIPVALIILVMILVAQKTHRRRGQTAAMDAGAAALGADFYDAPDWIRDRPALTLDVPRWSEQGLKK